MYFIKIYKHTEEEPITFVKIKYGDFLLFFLLLVIVLPLIILLFNLHLGLETIGTGNH